MQLNYFPTSDHLDAAIAISAATVGFMIFWSVVSSKKIIPRLAQSRSAEDAQEAKIHLQRVVGVTCFGIIPALVFTAGMGRSWSDFGVLARFSLNELWWTLGLAAVAVLLAYIGAQKAEGRAFYPEIRRSVWSTRTVVLSALGWTGYTIAYELLFRGFLLFSCERAFGIGAAIAINTSIYALAHVPKRMTEGIGSVVFGIILCGVTLQTGTIWVAMLVHIALALSNEWFALRVRAA